MSEENELNELMTMLQDSGFDVDLLIRSKKLLDLQVFITEKLDEIHKAISEIEDDFCKTGCSFIGSLITTDDMIKNVIVGENVKSIEQCYQLMQRMIKG